MAEQPPEAAQIAVTFPNPPPFWRDFTPDRLRTLETLRKERGAQSDEVRLADVPADLINLQPPAEPADGKWRVFGEEQTLNDELQTLEAAGIRRLGLPAPSKLDDRDGKHTDRALELKKMAKSLLLNFLELIGTMSINPAQGETKLEDLKVLLINFHHVLNEYRPHQARESLILLMQDQLDRKRAETEAVRAATARARKVLADLAAVGVEGVDTVGELGVEGFSLAETDESLASKDDGWAQRKITWNALEELV